MKKNSTNLRVRLPTLVFALEIMMVILYALFVTYDDHTNALLQNNKTKPTENAMYQDYPFFADIQVMIFIGFGCLLAFFRRYGFGGMAFNFLMAAFAIQWAILVQGFFQFYHDGKIHLGVINLINAEFACAVVLISFGAVLGKTSPLQLLVSLVLSVCLVLSLKACKISNFVQSESSMNNRSSVIHRSWLCWRFLCLLLQNGLLSST